MTFHSGGFQHPETAGSLAERGGGFLAAWVHSATRGPELRSAYNSSLSCNTPPGISGFRVQAFNFEQNLRAENLDLWLEGSKARDQTLAPAPAESAGTGPALPEVLPTSLSLVFRPALCSTLREFGRMKSPLKTSRLGETGDEGEEEMKSATWPQS
ncbi:hypothetical protein H1C71_002896 [Ictidomys tridecemlineatus]|nr:hypothetical protein H1C71_002896 [Ictidomys tridecemlineatus]